MASMWKFKHEFIQRPELRPVQEFVGRNYRHNHQSCQRDLRDLTKTRNLTSCFSEFLGRKCRQKKNRSEPWSAIENIDFIQWWEKCGSILFFGSPNSSLIKSDLQLRKRKRKQNEYNSIPQFPSKCRRYRKTSHARNGCY